MRLATHRSALMGLAILMVVVYHYGIWIANYFGPLNVGYVGVDLFLLLSAYGLTRSVVACGGVSKVSWLGYWRKRWVRIGPLFVLTTLVTTLITYHTLPWGAWCGTLALRLTTLAYYWPQHATPTDWYLTSLPLFYALIPLLYGVVRRRPWGVLGGVVAFTSLVVMGYWAVMGEAMHWRYDCVVSRVPLFVLGMCLALHRVAPWAYWIGATMAVMVAPLWFTSARFLSLSLCVPLVLPIVLWGLERLPRSVYGGLTTLGGYTLSAYCANLVLEAALPFVEGLLLRTAVYVVGQVLLTGLFVGVERRWGRA